jgi:hypothetical protein
LLADVGLIGGGGVQRIEEQDIGSAGDGEAGDVAVDAGWQSRRLRNLRSVGGAMFFKDGEVLFFAVFEDMKLLGSEAFDGLTVGGDETSTSTRLAAVRITGCEAVDACAAALWPEGEAADVCAGLAEREQEATRRAAQRRTRVDGKASGSPAMVTSEVKTMMPHKSSRGHQISTSVRRSKRSVKAAGRTARRGRTV